jgi:DNA repair ATPase RecN
VTDVLFSNHVNQAFAAVVTGLIAGVVIKFANKLLDSRKDKLDEHLLLRKELREELDAVLERVDKLQEELDTWKQKYFNQVQLTNELKTSILRLTHELDEYKQNTGQFPTNFGEAI